MPEKEPLQNETSEVVDNTDYIAAINQLKQNSVDRSQYDKLKAENKKLLDSIVNGQELDVKPSNQLRDPQEIRKELFNEEHNNLDYVTLMVELRNSLLSRGEPDPFLPYGSQIAPTPQDVEAAEKVAIVYQECIDYAQGDSSLFTQELQRRTNTSLYDKFKK